MPGMQSSPSQPNRRLNLSGVASVELTGKDLYDLHCSGAMGLWEGGEVEEKLLEGCRGKASKICALDSVAADFLHDFRECVVDGMVEIERCVVVDESLEGWARHLRDADGQIGVCWSYGGGAMPYSGGRGHSCFITAKVAVEHVDLAHSALLCAIKDGQWEARLRNDAEISILDVRGPNGPIETPLLGQTLGISSAPEMEQAPRSPALR